VRDTVESVVAMEKKSSSSPKETLALKMAVVKALEDYNEVMKSYKNELVSSESRSSQSMTHA
jgi:hypothetical protein